MKKKEFKTFTKTKCNKLLTMRWEYVTVVETAKGVKDSEIGYLYGESNGINLTIAKSKLKRKNEKIKIAGFDLDQTLISTESGKTFPIDSNDWKWMYDNVKDKLEDFINKGFEIVIITNQGGIKSSSEKMSVFKTKIENIEKDIALTHANSNIKFKIYGAVHKDVHRKPYPTFFKYINIDKNVDRDNSFFCGDGAGRPGDFTSGDIKFAYNSMLKFMTPEKMFLNEESCGIINYPIKPLDVKLFDSKNAYTYCKNDNDSPELIIMVGLPASGKSFIAQRIMSDYAMTQDSINYISLDVLKSKPKMIKAVQNSALNSESIIIDNTNLDIDTRANFIDIVKQIDNNYFVRIIHVNTSHERCLHNNYYRYFMNHRENPKLIPEFVYKMMLKKFIEPTKDENELIDKVEVANPSAPITFEYLYYYY